MKALLILITASCAGLIFLSSCKKESNEISKKNTEKIVVYSASFEQKSGNGALYVKGSYVDQNGKTVTLDKELPFYLAIKVPKTIKCSFQGYIYSVKATQLVGNIWMIVDNGGKKIKQQNKRVDISTANSLGFSSDELKTKTSFNFIED